MKAARVVLMAVGVIALATVAKKWFTPGGVYVPQVPGAISEFEPLTEE